MELLQRKAAETSRGFTFTYYISNPTSALPRPTLLLLHGFPDDSQLWENVVGNLTQFRLVVPDLLGYSGTSKPTDPSAYNFADHTKDLVEILDAERIEKVVSIGHDWGSILSQQLYVYHPSRVSGLVLLNAGYVLPSPVPSTLEATNKRLQQIFGYPIFAYHEFLVSDDAPAILKANAGRFYDGIHGAPNDWIRVFFCTTGNTHKWFLDDAWNVELRDYAKDPARKQAFIDRFQRDGFEGPLCYYKAMHNNVHRSSHKNIPEDRFIVKVPVMHIICTQDAICRPELSVPAKQKGCLPDLEEITLECGHWSPLEQPAVISDSIISFLERRFSS
jgi:soluble epoxide hydrolase / lipid-phosphate phosphatase